MALDHPHNSLDISPTEVLCEARRQMWFEGVLSCVIADIQFSAGRRFNEFDSIEIAIIA